MKTCIFNQTIHSKFAISRKKRTPNIKMIFPKSIILNNPTDSLKHPTYKKNITIIEILKEPIHIPNLVYGKMHIEPLVKFPIQHISILASNDYNSFHPYGKRITPTLFVKFRLKRKP